MDDTDANNAFHQIKVIIEKIIERECGENAKLPVSRSWAPNPTTVILCGLLDPSRLRGTKSRLDLDFYFRYRVCILLLNGLKVGVFHLEAMTVFLLKIRLPVSVAVGGEL